MKCGEWARLHGRNTRQGQDKQRPDGTGSNEHEQCDIKAVEWQYDPAMQSSTRMLVRSTGGMHSSAPSAEAPLLKQQAQYLEGKVHSESGSAQNCAV